MSVDLPAPLAPSRPVAGASSARVTPSSAVTAPKRLTSPSTAIRRAPPATGAVRVEDSTGSPV